MTERDQLLSVNKPLENNIKEESKKIEINIEEKSSKTKENNNENLDDLYNEISSGIINNDNKINNNDKNNINITNNNNDNKNITNNTDNKNNNTIDNKINTNQNDKKNINNDNKNVNKNDNNIINNNPNNKNNNIINNTKNDNNNNKDIKTHDIKNDEKLNNMNKQEINKNSVNNNNIIVNGKEPEKDPEKKTLKKQDSIHFVEDQIREKEKIYEIDPEFKNRLLEALKKKGKIRPKTIFNLEEIDRTKTTAEIEKIIQKTQEENKIQESQTKTENNLKKDNPNEPKLNSLEDSIALFGPVKKIYMDQFYKLSDMFVCCPLYFNYRLSFDFGTGVAFHLFDSREYSPACSHDCCPNQSREIDIDLIKYDILTGKKVKFLTMKKEFRCACLCCCACCSRPTMEVTIDKKRIGKIREIRTACDPTIYIFNYLGDLKFKIKGSCCQCGYCFKDLCSQCCKNCEFEIFTNRDLEYEKPLGKIKKCKRSGEKVRPDYDQLEIDFPENANPNDKILILCATFLLETLYFQNHSNSKRCHGDPLY